MNGNRRKRSGGDARRPDAPKSHRVLLVEHQQRTYTLDQPMEKRLVEMRKQARAAVSLDKFVRLDEDVAGRVAQSTVGLVEREAFRAIKQSISNSNLQSNNHNSKASNHRVVVDEEKKRVMPKLLSFEDEEEATTTVGQQQQPIAILKRPAMEKSPEEQSAVLSTESATTSTSTTTPKTLLPYKTVRLMTSHYDGTDHPFHLDCHPSWTVGEILEAARVRYPPLSAYRKGSLLLVKAGQILMNRELRPFQLPALFQVDHPTSTTTSSTSSKTFDLHEALVGVERQRNCRIVSSSWYQANKHRQPASSWRPYEE